MASSGLQSHDETIWRAEEAPGQDEIIWANLRMRSWERGLRSAAMWALFVVMVLFFGIVCTALQGFVNIKQLDKTPVIKDIVSIPFIRSLIVGILPGAPVRTVSRTQRVYKDGQTLTGWVVGVLDNWRDIAQAFS